MSEAAVLVRAPAKKPWHFGSIFDAAAHIDPPYDM